MKIKKVRGPYRLEEGVKYIIIPKRERDREREGEREREGDREGERDRIIDLMRGTLGFRNGLLN